MSRLSFFLTLLFAASVLTAQITDRDIRQSRNAFSEGVRKGVENDFAAAHELFNQAITLDSLYSEAYLYRGLARLELERFEEAIDDFRHIIHLDREMAFQANYFSGITLLAMDKYHEALIHLNEAVRLNPDFSSFFHRGKAFFYLDRYEQALKDFNVSDRLNPGFPEVFYYRGKAHASLAMYDQAMEDLLLAKNHYEENPEFHYYLGSVLQQMGRTSEAASHLSIAEKAFGSPLQPLYKKQEDEIITADTSKTKEPLKDSDLKVYERSPTVETREEKGISELAEGLYNVNMNNATPRGLGVQIASYANAEDVLEHAERYQRQFGHPAFIEIVEVNNRIRYRLILGIFDSRDEALLFRGELRDYGFLDSFVIRYP